MPGIFKFFGQVWGVAEVSTGKGERKSLGRKKKPTILECAQT